MKKYSFKKSNSLATCLLLIFSLFLIGEVSAITYYVAPNGNDKNSGSINAPFSTIQRAADIVNPGDTVIVKDGTYTDTDGNEVIVFLQRGGTSANWITFKAEKKWGAVLDGQNKANFGFTCDKNYAQYIRIEDFEVKNTRYGGIGAGGNNIYVYRNKVHDIGRYYVDPCVNYGDAAQGRVAMGAGSSSSYITIDSNVIYNIGRLPGGACTQYSWWDYNHDHGLYISASNVTVKNNIFYNCKSGWVIQIYSSSPVTKWTVMNNTFYGTNPEREGHILLSGSQSAWLIQNNIFHSPKSSAIQGSPSDDTNVVIRNNLVYNASITASENCDGVRWICSNNISGDPRFTNLSGYDFHLLSDSPAIDKGLSFSGRTKDADGNSIVGIPDIGAFEAGGVSEDTIPPAPPAIIEVK